MKLNINNSKNLTHKLILKFVIPYSNDWLCHLRLIKFISIFCHQIDFINLISKDS